jgi:hypothetical protein
MNPASWTNFTSAAWCSATIALRAASTSAVTWAGIFAQEVTSFGIVNESRLLRVKSYHCG